MFKPSQQTRIFLLLLGICIAMYAVMIILTQSKTLALQQRLPAFHKQEPILAPANNLLNVTTFSLR
jgi:hypothetical protein